MNPELGLCTDKRIDEYVLIGKLSSYSHVWHAFDEGAQREVVLKFVPDRESADREGTVLADIDHPNILKLLRKFVHEGIQVLVFEYVAGARLDKVIRKGMAKKDCLTICMDICSALAEIHKYGLFHGDLSPFNVIWSSAKEKAFLIDFGAMGGCTVLSAAPEHDPANRTSIGPHTDIVGLGRILMLLLPGMKNIYEKCLYDKIEQRPTAQHVFKVLKHARDRRKNWLRALASAMVLLMVGLGSALLVNGRRPTHYERVLKAGKESSLESLTTLKGFLNDLDFADHKNLVVRFIAEHHTRMGKEAVIVPDLNSYIAIFAVKRNPIVILKEGVLQLGDLAVIEGRGGYILEVNKGNLILKTENGSKQINYPKPEIFDRQTQIYKPISIMPGNRNFLQIIRIICNINEYQFNANGLIDGNISGGFPAATYLSFFDSLVGHIRFDGYNVNVMESAIPRSVISAESFWLIRGNKLSVLLARYEPYIGYSCEYLGESDPADLIYPVMQFNDLINTMGLKITVAGQKIQIRKEELQ